ncbi:MULTISPECIES: hypothetical protein [unclassified Neorhizobium]|uniref:hypothetical protein n=1 Tax=unclassified Neorhizobium TaxID=2629175 RepID=UPI001FF63468|nr:MULTISPECIES: hypothetical protein [unclassified Neorhizobium]MCJ9668989.1 hypothetical protein [Neorhizobium sp. SHOUNA12B]MCJ9744943.1 hypothetical protein [Neorhizobium sp. SHOUNA12A]
MHGAALGLIFEGSGSHLQQTQAVSDLMGFVDEICEMGHLVSVVILLKAHQVISQKAELLNAYAPNCDAPMDRPAGLAQI